MSSESMFHRGNREFQDVFETRQLADRLEEKLARSTFTDDDRQFIGRQSLFFLATANGDGLPDCSYKGGPPGFVRVLDEATLAFPSYDGNGMFKSLGNLQVNPKVGLLFIDFESPRRLRVNGTATASTGDPLLPSFPGAQVIVRVRPLHIFPNCPRYIPRMQILEPSPYVPVAGVTPPVPNWKLRPEFNCVLPARDPARVQEKP